MNKIFAVFGGVFGLIFFGGIVFFLFRHFYLKDRKKLRAQYTRRQKRTNYFLRVTETKHKGTWQITEPIKSTQICIDCNSVLLKDDIFCPCCGTELISRKLTDEKN